VIDSNQGKNEGACILLQLHIPYIHTPRKSLKSTSPLKPK
jgi:hypothetical protein